MIVAERGVTEIRLDERRGVDHSIEREVSGYRVSFAPALPAHEALP